MMSFDLGNAARTALLVMDFQNDIVNPRSEVAQKLGFAKEVEKAGVVDNFRRLLEAFRKAGLTVVHVVVDFSANKNFQTPQRGRFIQAIKTMGPMMIKGTWGAEIIHELKPLPDEPVIRKPFFSAFSGTELHEVLRSRNISQLILTGVSTDFVVDSTSWSASDLGYDVIVAENACACSSIKIHEDAIQRLAARADITDVDSIIQAIRLSSFGWSVEAPACIRRLHASFQLLASPPGSSDAHRPQQLRSCRSLSRRTHLPTS